MENHWSNLSRIEEKLKYYIAKNANIEVKYRWKANIGSQSRWDGNYTWHIPKYPKTKDHTHNWSKIVNRRRRRTTTMMMLSPSSSAAAAAATSLLGRLLMPFVFLLFLSFPSSVVRADRGGSYTHTIPYGSEECLLIRVPKDRGSHILRWVEEERVLSILRSEIGACSWRCRFFLRCIRTYDDNRVCSPTTTDRQLI